MQRAMTVLAGVLAMLIAACTGDGDTAVEAAEQLDAALVAEGPPGFRVATAADGFPRGPFRLEEFLEVYSTDPDTDRALLTANDFVAGHTRTWVDDRSGAVATVIGFAFGDGRGARTVEESFVDEAVAAGGGETFPVPDLAGATGVAATHADDDGTQHVQSVSYVAGSRLFTVALVTRDAPGGVERIVAFARRQGQHRGTA